MRKDSIGAEPQAATLSIEEALNQAEALIESGRYQEACKKLHKISSNFQFPIISQESYCFHYLRALLSFRLGKEPEAWEEVEKALQIFKMLNALISLPENENIPDFVKKNLRKLRDIEVALLAGLQEPDGKQALEKERKLEERIVEVSNALDNLKPLTKLHYLAGCIKLRMAKLDEAAEHFERAATGSLLSKNWSVLARALNGITHINFNKGEIGLAIQINEKARAYNCKAGDPHFETILRNNLTYYQLNLGLWRPAISSLPGIFMEMKKFKDIPNYCSALLNWGYANLLRSHLKESKKAFGKAFRIAAKHNLTGILKLANGFFSEFYLQAGQFEKAENHLKKTLEIARRVTPGDSAETFSWRMLGDVYAAQRQFEKAQKAYAACQNCLVKFPDKLEEASVYQSVGMINSYQGQLRAARKHFKKALEVLDTCNNHWEKAKILVIAAESGVFTQTEMEPEIVWAKDVFKKLEHPTWIKRARALLKKEIKPARPIPLPLARERTEREQIVQALLTCNGNITQAAKKLGLLRETLRYKIRRYGIEV